jgi:hypothetical protein
LTNIEASLAQPTVGYERVVRWTRFGDITSPLRRGGSRRAVAAERETVADGEQDCGEEDQPDAGNEAEARHEEWMALVV